MATRDLASMVASIDMMHQGDVAFMDEVSLPLIKALKKSLTEAGLKSAIENPRLPPQRGHSRNRVPQFRMEAGLAATALVGLTIFLSSSVGGWAVQKVCDELWERHIKPIFGRLRNRRKPTEWAGGPFVFQLRIYYSHDEIGVTVRAEIRSEADLDAALELVPHAERRALAWLESKGIDCDELVYSIRGGELSTIPRKIAGARPDKQLPQAVLTRSRKNVRPRDERRRRRSGATGR